MVGRNPFPLFCPTRRRLSRAIALGGAREAGAEWQPSDRRSVGRCRSVRKRAGGGRVLPFCPNGCACRKPKSGGRGLLLLSAAVRRSSSWLDEGRVVRPGVRLSPAGFTVAGVDNYLATLARLRSGRVMGIGTAEAGGGRSSALGLEGLARVRVVGGRRAVSSSLKEGRLRLPVRGNRVRSLGPGLWAGGGRRGRVMQPGRRGRVAPSIWMGGRRCVRWRWRSEVLPSGQRAAGGGVPRARVDNCLATSQEARRQDGGR